MPTKIETMLQILGSIKGHLTVIGFILSLLTGLTIAIVKPQADDYIKKIIKGEGFAVASNVEEVQKEVSKTQMQIEQLDETIDGVKTDTLILKNRLDDVKELLEDQDARQERNMQEIRRLLLQ